ncbi:Putative LOC100902024 [Caligus rogercresseyi]|uniref:LOC100902024 n=1 Tax=Caligus rogercresseyi TaxID=217165 RepID=A0A7T8KFE3_CALRO|nr:Putative LOC100902024 [Caligus rogercresseyi]
MTGALFKVFGEDFDNNSLHLLVTDGATYCLKAGRGLKKLFPNMKHVTCICHALNRVAE